MRVCVYALNFSPLGAKISQDRRCWGAWHVGFDLTWRPGFDVPFLFLHHAFQNMMMQRLGRSETTQTKCISGDYMLQPLRVLSLHIRMIKQKLTTYIMNLRSLVCWCVNAKENRKDIFSHLRFCSSVVMPKFTSTNLWRSDAHLACARSTWQAFFRRQEMRITRFLNQLLYGFRTKMGFWEYLSEKLLTLSDLILLLTKFSVEWYIKKERLLEVQNYSQGRHMLAMCTSWNHKLWSGPRSRD